MKNLIFRTAACIALMTALTNFISAALVARTASGANAAAIQATVDQFRADLGGANNGVGGSFTTGRREINWDGVPDNFAAPNFLPVSFFNANSPRGIVFSTNTVFGDSDSFLVSADSNNPTNTPVRFGNIDASYSSIFQTFSAERLFIARQDNVTEITFYIPGTDIPATVSGFGAVFCDPDAINAEVYIKFYDVTGKRLAKVNVPASNNGLAFAGASFSAGERIARVEIVAGNERLGSGITDGAGVDVVAMDDFIFGEPRAATFHSGDFDGDGTADLSVFRPSNGGWFALNSGSNTFSVNFFGTNGDIPIDGDFDGDSRADLAVFRPSTGTWFRQVSSNGQFTQNQFGANGDKPVPGDYDKDGKTDIAVWRPSSGIYFIQRSTDNGFSITQWGATGDIPLGGAAQ